MSYIQQHSFSQYQPSSELSLQHYIPDQSVELYPNGSVKFLVNEKCKTLESQLQQILQMNDKIKIFVLKINSLKLERLDQSFQAIKSSYKYETDSLWGQQSSLQTFIYNFHNSKIFLDLMDDFIRRKEQARMIESFMKIKTIKKKKVLLKQNSNHEKIKQIKCTPSLLLIKGLFRKKLSQAFLTILKNIQPHPQRSTHTALTDISSNELGYSRSQMAKSNFTYQEKDSISSNQSSFYTSILRDHGGLFSKSRMSTFSKRSGRTMI